VISPKFEAQRSIASWTVYLVDEILVGVPGNGGRIYCELEVWATYPLCIDQRFYCALVGVSLV
jgi:hypothetical protein